MCIVLLSVAKAERHILYSKRSMLIDEWISCLVYTEKCRNSLCV